MESLSETKSRVWCGNLGRRSLGRRRKAAEKYGEEDTRPKRKYHQRSSKGGVGVVIAESEKRHDEAKILEEDIKDGTREVTKKGV